MEQIEQRAAQCKARLALAAVDDQVPLPLHHYEHLTESNGKMLILICKLIKSMRGT